MLDQSQTGYFDTVLVDQLSIVERLRDVEHLRYIPLVLITPQIPQLNLKVSHSLTASPILPFIDSLKLLSTVSTSVSQTASNHQRTLKTCVTRFSLPSKPATGYPRNEVEMHRSRFFSPKTVSSFATKANRGSLALTHCLYSDIVNQKVALKFLESAGHQTEVVENGALALEAVKKNFYDVSQVLYSLYTVNI
jgi:osomolarity two-component system sensor histidine kinase NIK1